jgi:hypothetical protein
VPRRLLRAFLWELLRARARLVRSRADARLCHVLAASAARAPCSTLLELLELGSLLDTCVRNGSYDEALDLEAFCAKLAAAAPGVPLAAALAGDARAGVRAMLAQLLARLRGPVQLPECLRIVGYLRRLGVFGEGELRLTFLRCRDAWLSACCAELDAGAPYEYAKRLTDTHRVHLFDAVMQFRAIFADDTSAADGLGGMGGMSAGGVGASDAGGLVYAWATHRMCAYLDALGATLPRLVEGATLASVLEHCAYCGASLGRVGLDFRGLLHPMFEECVAAMTQRALAAAVDAFERALAQHAWAQPHAALPRTSASAAATPATTTTTQPGGTSGEDELAPPACLMEQPPVASFVNALLAALNELRHVALPALRTPLAAAMHDALCGAAGALVRCHGARATVLNDATAPQFASLAASLADVAAPYAAACFGRVYPGAAAEVNAAQAMAGVRALLTQLQRAQQPAAAVAHAADAAPAAAAPPPLPPATPQPASSE